MVASRATALQVDWTAPWLAPYRDVAHHASGRLADTACVAKALNDALTTRPAIPLAAGPLRFVDSRELPQGEAYEAFIARTASVPTRDNLHDLFNGLVWLRFPALKRRLNELQSEQIAQAGIGATRGAVRDALTLFDENAALWQAPPGLVEALRRRDWHALFITDRQAWRDARLTLFSHALMEKLTQPRKAITAHVWLVPEEQDAQAFLAASLTPELLSAKPHLPLPVLGVPGWWQENEAQGFYDDASVFRPCRG